MEPEDSSPHSQAPATCPYPEPSQSSPHTHIETEDTEENAGSFCQVYINRHSQTRVVNYFILVDDHNLYEHWGSIDVKLHVLNLRLLCIKALHFI
jgi:hypothetical protein